MISAGVTTSQLFLIVERERNWQLHQADWPNFRVLCREELTTNISDMNSFTRMLRLIVKKPVPRTLATPKRLTPPWSDDACRGAIRE